MSNHNPRRSNFNKRDNNGAPSGYAEWTRECRRRERRSAAFALRDALSGDALSDALGETVPHGYFD